MATVAVDRNAQRMVALKKANTVRAARSHVKEDLKHRRMSIRDVLMRTPEYMEGVVVFDLLVALPFVGRTKANKLCQRHRIRPSLALKNMSAQTRAELILAVEALGGRK